jgi:hypothetical protein
MNVLIGLLLAKLGLGVDDGKISGMPVQLTN